MKFKNLFSRTSAAPKPAPMTHEEWAKKELADMATPLVSRAIHEAHQNAK
jgi:hypothetical protein